MLGVYLTIVSNGARVVCRVVILSQLFILSLIELGMLLVPRVLNVSLFKMSSANSYCDLAFRLCRKKGRGKGETGSEIDSSETKFSLWRNDYSFLIKQQGVLCRTYARKTNQERKVCYILFLRYG